MNKPILSVVIPSYNIELYLEETVSSITKSKYCDKIEILIINDGSTDNTLKIAKELSEQCQSIRVIDKPNGGHGSAINSGLEYATGKYFRLLDGDDWFDTNEFDLFIEKLQDETADLVFTDLVECFIKQNFNRPVTYYENMPENKVLKLSDIKFSEWGPMLPTTTIKTSVLKKFNLKIDEKCFYVDQEYNLACYLAAKTAIYYPLMVYHYRLEREGQSMERTSLIRNVKSHEKVCARLLSEYKKHSESLNDNQRNYLEKRVIIPMCHMQYMIIIEWCKSRKDFLSFDKRLAKYPELYQNPSVAGTLTNFHRKTKGHFVSIDPCIRMFANIRMRFRSSKPSASSYLAKIMPAIGFVSIILIANFIVINYLRTENSFYYWDLSGYWKNGIELTNTFKTSFGEGIRMIVGSMSTDYNYLPLVPMVPFMLIFGTSRLSFMLIALNLYILPFALLIIKTISVALKDSPFQIKKWVKPLIFAVACLSPAILIPIINGRPDAICLILVALIFYHLAKTRLECISNYFTLAVLVFVLIVLRRYFSFWAVSLYAAIFMVKTFMNFKNFSPFKVAALKSLKVAIKLFLSGILILTLMFIFTHGILARYLTGNYSDIYAAYLLGDFWNQVALFIRYYGLIYLALVLIGIALICIRLRKTSLSELNGILLITSILSFFMFTRVQTLGDQHMYLFAPFFVLVASAPIFYIANHNKYKFLAFISPIIILGLSVYSFTGKRAESCSNLCYVTGISEIVRPVIRQDVSEIEQLVSDLENTMNMTDYVYVLSSSDSFNDDLLRNTKLPSYPNFNISGVKHVDKRDGFPNYFFDASYIIIADPIQTHLTPGTQDVISVLAKKILNGQADNLQFVKDYNIDNNVTLKLYRKVSPYNPLFLSQIKSYFENKYSEYDYLYKDIPLTN